MVQNRADTARLKEIRHHLNSLHIYCRLHSLGISHKTSMKLSKIWERYVHPIIY
ncbi:MAG: hypothetical protein IME98_05740 [Proteobacteria bacterium]|nr:hypothetical protein [Pseudomonadota bacterium]